MKKTGSRLLALALTLAMLISTVPTQVFGYMAEKGEKLSITGKDGKIVTEDESWVTTFPYGTFAFERGDIIVGEGGAEVTLKLYRMGGTTGRATALISYDPVIAKMADGTGAYANAAGSKDITITVEDPLPIAQYQALGKDPEPLQPEKPVALVQGEYHGAESQPGDISLTPEIVADTYRWECLFGTEWEPVNGAVNREFVVSGADYPDFDYRCIYTVGEKTYCTNSAKGTVYVPAADEVLPAMPENMQLNPDPTYTTIQTDPNNDYLGYEFIMTFADGEFVKEIKLSSPEDNLAEAEKFGAFTIIDHEGGTLYDAANTVALHVMDNDAPEASQLGFAVTDIEADKASGDAVLTVRRTGGNQQVLTLDYETKDGTAVAGKDYMASKGSLIFYADADEQKITVPLVNDGIASEERSSFTIALSNLKGDEGKLCTLTDTVATVSLWNSGKTENANLATLLQDGGAEDISGAITEGTGSVAPVGVETITGKQVIEDVAEPMIGKIEKGDTSLLTYDYADPIKFVRATGDNLNNYWRDYYWFARVGDDYGYPWDVNNTGPDPFRSNWTGNGESAGRYHSHTLRSVLNEDNRLIVDDALFEEHFDRMQAVCQFTAEWVSTNDWNLSGGTYTYGNVGVISHPQNEYPRVVGGATCNPYIVKEGLKHKLKFTPQDYMNASWSMQDDITNITLNTICDGTDRPSLEPAVSTLRSGILHRRSLDNDVKLRIVTANDANNKGEAEGLQEDFYKGIRPSVTVIPGEGGVTPSGKLYVGSKLKVDIGVAGGSYGIDNMALPAVCVTNSAGKVVTQDLILSPDHKSATLTMGWDDIYLPDTYTINVILLRTQKFNLDIAPSVPRLENNQQAIDSSKIGAAWDAFWASGEASKKGSITIGRAPAVPQPVNGILDPDLVYKGIEEIALSRSDFIGGTNAIFNPQYQQFNIQWINFNRSADDVIVYNGRSFPGNEKIWLQQKDFALEQMQFFYYSKEYLSAESVMVTTLQKTGLYLDMNCNGMIDGKWNSGSGFFELDPASKDEFVAFLQDGVDYDENLFAPIEVGKRSDGSPKYAQYFMKVTYTMNPRALQPVPGTDLTKRAQVLPALITKLTEPASYNKLTDQQKAYRYVVSGMNQVDDKAAVRSADNHIMFGAAATEAATIDIPLGGDTSPATLNGDKKTFSWAPNYWGNLLYPFANPEPIVVPHSLAGDNIPIAEADSVGPDGKITYKQEDGARRLNGYLGSYTANDTFALCVREQEKDTNTIAAENHVTWNANAAEGGGLSLKEIIAPPPEKGHPTPESVTLGKTGTFANTEYLKASNSPSANKENATMEGSENEYPEFDQDIGVKLPSSEVGVTDFVTIIMDEYEVGFAIGIPMGGYNSNGDAGAGGTGTGANSGTTTKDKWSGPKGAYKSSGSNMKAMKDWMGAKKGDRMQAFKDSSDDYPASGKAEPASSHAVDFALSFAFMFKYDKVENTYHFSQFKFTASASYTFSYQVRFTPAPMLYFFVTVGGSIEIETGATIDRVIVENGTPKISDTNPLRLPDNDSYKFQAAKRVWNITFKGKLLVECFTDEACKNPYDKEQSTKGYVTSDGMEPVTLNLLKQVAMDVPTTCWVKLTALTDTDVTRLVELEKMETKSYFSGLGIAPSVFLEVGFGLGVEIVKVEIFVKVNIDFAMMLGKYNEDSETYDPFSFDEFNFGLGLGIRIVALIFNYELDVIQYNLGYNKEDHVYPKTGWKHGWKALNGMFGGEAEISATDSQGNTFAVRIRMPGDASQTQNIYSNEKPTGDVDPLAYDPSGANVPFQLSGYVSSGDAFKFADGLITGYDYKVVTANNDNYLIYTISRPNSKHAVNNSMLVMSKIKLTSTNEQDSYGLVNPLNDAAEQKYIMLDTKTGSKDDGTGDLEFKAWTDKAGKIYATWVSYATEAVPQIPKPTAPDAATYIKPVLADKTEMDETNYTNTAFAPVAPTVVAEPKLPLATDYFLTADAYTALSEQSEKDKYEVATDDAGFYVVKTLLEKTKAAADAALLEATNAYTPLKAAYDQYVLDQAAYVTKNAAFTVWKDYFTSLATHKGEIQAIAAAAAKNTVVKTASFDATQSATGFTEAKVVSGSADAHVFLPIPADEKVTIYAKATHYSEDEKTAAKKDFTDYISAKVYDLKNPPEAPAELSKSSTAQFRLMTEEGLWDAYGKGSKLCVAVDGAAQVVEVPVTPGQTIDNIEAAKIDGTYYVAYTTSQKQYMTAEATAAASGAVAADYVNIRRLMLKTFTVDATTGAVTWTNADGTNKALLLRTIYDYDFGVGACQDGVYKNGTLVTKGAYKDPTFSNLQFLNAQLGALEGTNEDFETMSVVPPEDFLLFDMNGSTYVIPQADLKKIATEKKGRIIPFFAPGAKSSTTDSSKKGASTGRGETTIGADGAGNLSAVYVGTVPYTLNNALYLSKYDPISTTWGAGTMLAMNYMQVHEDGIKNGWTGEETEKAFLGKKEGYEVGQKDGGGLNQFKFTNLQIALGQKKTTKDVSGSALSLATDASGEISVPAPEITDLSLAEAASDDTALTAAGTGTKDTLLVLTQGSMTYLTAKEVDVPDVGTTTKKQTVVTPVDEKTARTMYEQNKADPAYVNRVPGVGVYAVSYGVGEQAIGESNVVFMDYDFSQGSKLKVSLGFKNTGDVGIRASAANPALVKLKLKTGGATKDLATWEIKANILAGQKVELSGVCSELTETLQKGDIFYIEVCEDPTYATDGFTADTLLDKDGNEVGNLKVGEKADLSFSSADSSIKPIGTDAKGDTILQVDLFAQNRGNAGAGGVFAQFSYETNVDADNDGKMDYAPINLTGHKLVTADEEELKPFGGITEGGATNLANGIYYLRSKSGDIGSTGGGNHISINHGRKVTGTFTVPSSYYQGSLTGSLNLRVELFSVADDTTRWNNGLVIAEHKEYNTNNNFLSMQIEHDTFYQSASKVTIPMGTTMRLPLQLSTTKGVAPDITVHEVPANGEKAHIGVSYYTRHGDFTAGRESGTLILAPSSEGKGVIHLEDVNTNSIYAVAYTVTVAGDGLNIYNDTDMFTFKQANGDPITPESKDWKFESGVPSWGAAVEGKVNAPYLSNLAKGKVGASFTYRTQAKSIKLYFDGTVEVSSDFPGYTPKTVSATGGGTFAEVKFGENDSHLAHNVTIKVVSASRPNVAFADFDRIVEAFGVGAPPAPSGDKNSPHLFWSRSFPETATLTAGPVALTGYILDDGTLASVTLNGSEAPNITKTAEGFWQFTTNITENGVLNLSAIDTSGNRTTRNTRIDWFNTSASAGSKNAPTLDAELVKTDGSKLAGYLGKGESAFIKATTSGTATSASYYGKNAKGGLEKTSLIAESDGRFAVANNGFYVVTAQNAKAQEWSAKVIYMKYIDQAMPVLTLTKSDTSTQSGGGLALSWSAQKEDKNATATIASADINENALSVTSGKTWVGGSFPVTHAGEYTLTATDTAGNSKSTSITLADIPVKNPGGTLATVTNAWNNDGSVAVNLANIVGGKYDEAKSNKAGNSYKGSYEWNLSEPADWQTTATGTVSSLAPGAYTLSVRDANDKENVQTILTETLTVGDEAVALTLKKATVGGGTGGGSALHTLDWTAKKGAGASENITKITMNGKDIAITQGKELGGSLPLEYGGAYELIATSGGKTFTKAETLANVPVTTSSKDALLTIERPWNTALDNGKLTINLTTGATQKNLTGGKYNPAVLSAENAYVGSYEWRLEPAVSHADSAAEAAWLAEQVAKTDGWTTAALSGLTVGNYILIIQDAQDRGNAATALTIPVAITSELVTFKATPKLAASSSAADGAIDVAAFGGYQSQNVFQFAARPIKDEKSMGTIEAVTAPLGAEYPVKNGWKQPAWQLGDLAKRLPEQSTLSELRSGWYQVAVRTMLDVTAADMTALMDLYKAYTDAVTAKEDKAVIEAAKQAYETKKTNMENTSNAGYTATPGLWANAATVAVYVPAVPEPDDPPSGEIKPSDLDYKTEGVVQVTLNAKKPVLTPKAEAQLIADNKDKDLVIGSPMMEVRIPAGSLSAGDDLSAMLMPTVALPQDASGYVVQYTDKDGVTHLLPLSLVTSEKVTYVAGEPGSYSLVQNTKHFDDIPADFWGEDEIYFVTQRGLFQGAGKDQFSHTEPMTRGMFVTVLGRLAGANPAEYSDTSFSDVAADSWYGGYAAWASQNNIASGVGKKKFDPDASVSREQMCVMLVRYLDLAKIKLPAVAPATSFTDQSELSPWAEQAVRQLVAAGIIEGSKSGALRPGAEASRAEVAAIYARLIKAILGA